jgi:hypothetical protein
MMAFLKRGPRYGHNYFIHTAPILKVNKKTTTIGIFRLSHG